MSANFFGVNQNIGTALTLLQNNYSSYMNSISTTTTNGTSVDTWNPASDPNMIALSSALSSNGTLNINGTNFFKTAGNIYNGQSQGCALSLTGMIGNLVEPLGNLIASIFGGNCSPLLNIANLLENGLNIPGLGNAIINGAVSDIENFVGSTIIGSPFVQGALSDISSTLDSFGSSLSSLTSSISNTVGGLVNGVTSGLSEAMNFINCIPSALPQPAIDALNSVGTFTNPNLISQINTNKQNGIDTNTNVNNAMSYITNNLNVNGSISNLVDQINNFNV